MSLGLARCVVEVLASEGSLVLPTGDDVDGLNVPSALTWRANVIPEDPSGCREFREWRVPVLVQFALAPVERFQ